MTRWHFGVAAIVIGLSAGLTAQNKQEARDMSPPPHNDLQARSAYAPVIHRQGDRYIAYVGHHGGSKENEGNEARGALHRKHRRTSPSKRS